MAASQIEIESQAVDISETAFETFCNDLAGMFGIEIECSQNEVCEENIQGLKKRFGKLVAVNTVDSTGILSGTFQLIFDQEGMFTLGGVIIMLPEQRIIENRKRGMVEDNASMLDSISEMGNLLVGSWDRVYRENLEGHKHFVQRLPAYIGKPWMKPQEIGLSKDEELIFVPYEMKVEPFPAFHCGVIFPKSLFLPKAEEKPQETVQEEKKAPMQAQTAPVIQPSDQPQKQEQAKSGDQNEAKIEVREKTEQNPPEKSRKESPVCRKCGEKHFHFEPCPHAKAESTVTEHAMGTEEIPAEIEPKESQPVSEAIKKLSSSPAVLPGEHSELSLTICAGDIMDKEVVWAGPGDSVQQALTMMQQHDIGYLLVGKNGNLEGIVSRSDIAGAVSPY
ncbi:MAG: CBS domain-containing protein, partial [Candidatus Atribacteria bacterium]